MNTTGTRPVDRATFVLVHGAFHGGWCWQRVRTCLNAKGYSVYTPTLTGQGERQHLATPEIGLETHIEDVAALIDFEGLEQVVLVGHSYGGVVVTGVAARMPSRISHLVYLDAIVPEPGDSSISLMDPSFGPVIREAASKNDPPWLIPVFDIGRYGVTDSADLTWLESRLTPQPVKPISDPLPATAAEELDAIPRTFIYCAQNRGAASHFGQFAEAYRHRPGWTYAELPTGHDAMITMPEEVAALLERAAT
jgi:pimeloyl-ACP methyl ester carboxylesterase